MLAELLAAQQMLGSGLQITSLTSDLAHPDVHVRRAPQHRPGFVGGEPQRLLIGAHGLTQAALGEADVRQGDRTAEDVGEVPCPLQSVGTDGIGLVRALQVSNAPQREAPQARGSGPRDVVPFSREVDGPLGMRDRCAGVATH